MIEVVLDRSWANNKKFAAIISVNNVYKKTVHFGDNRYEDYTIHKDDNRKTRYESRHRKNENWNDVLSAGFWSKNLLWNKKTLDKSIKDIENNYGIKIYTM